jgi:O-antigen ligase
MKLLHFYVATILASVFAALILEEYLLFFLPLGALIIYLLILRPKFIFFLLLFTLPLSTEFTFSNGWGTDLPTEPLMVMLFSVFPIWIAWNPHLLSKKFLTHPITIILLVHLFWIFITALNSDNFIVSIKYFLAKTWYIIVFYFIAGIFQDFKIAIKFIFYPLLLTVIITLIRHALIDFSFADVHKVFHPYQRNHVNYAAMLTLFLPLLWLLWKEEKKKNWLAGIIIFLIGIYFSYTRAAYISILLMGIAWFIFEKRWIKPILGIGLVITIIAIGYLFYENQYLNYSTNYEQTISHKEFDQLISATYQGKDISTMERFYRWVAGARMGAEKFIFGFGPGNFLTFYKTYTVEAFRTYVSHNPEGSGIHNYFLMLFAEQGLIGLLIFLSLVLVFFIKGESLYFQYKSPVVLTILVSMVTIIAFQLINDLIETDKVGPFFFIYLAVLVNAEIHSSGN